MSLTIKETEQLAKLARLELSAEEKEKYSKDISSILQYVNKLQELKTSAQGGPASGRDESITRDDIVVGKTTAEQKELVSRAPDVEDGLIKTKAVF